MKQAALAVGFDDCGIARADALTDDEYPLREWFRRGWHGDLAYMERNADKRMDPRLLLPGAKSVICLVSAYPPPDSVRYHSSVSPCPSGKLLNSDSWLTAAPGSCGKSSAVSSRAQRKENA